MADDYTIPEHRDLTSSERQLLEWLLENGSSEAADYKPQLANAKVVSRCSCGCPSIDLAIGERNSRTVGASTILCDAHGHSPEGVSLMVTLHARGGELSELEVITDEDVDVCTMPTPATLEPIRWTPHNKSLDASGGSVFRNIIGAAKGALICAAASTTPLCFFFR